MDAKTDEYAVKQWKEFALNVLTFDYDTISTVVKQTLREALGDNTLVVTDEGYQGRVHVKVVSDIFNGKSEREKQNYVWDVIHAHLDIEAQQAISVVMCYATDDL